jgi:hypothetical protein
VEEGVADNVLGGAVVTADRAGSDARGAAVRDVTGGGRLGGAAVAGTWPCARGAGGSAGSVGEGLAGTEAGGVAVAAGAGGAVVAAGALVAAEAAVAAGAAIATGALVDAEAVVEGGDRDAGVRSTATNWGAGLCDGAGAGGAKSTINTESPTKPITSAAPPNMTSVFSDRPGCAGLRG